VKEEKQVNVTAFEEPDGTQNIIGVV